MILVTLGTQDKSFERLLIAVEEAIDRGIIKDQVIVQAGYTKFHSDQMEIFDFIPKDEFEALMKKCDLLITHGGVGSVFDGLKQKKKMIVVPRLSKYKEHTNDHQLQIVEQFAKEGYILSLEEMDQFPVVLEKIKSFQPKTYQSNQNNMIHLLEHYIETERSRSMMDKIKSLFLRYKEIIMYLIFGVLTTVVNIVAFYFFDEVLTMNTYLSNTIAWILSVIFAFITNKLFVFESKEYTAPVLIKEGISFFGFRLLSYGMDMLCMYIMIDLCFMNKMLSKVVSNVLVIVANYVFSKLFIFNKK